MINNTLVGWYSKGKAKVQSSTFGSKIITMRTGIDKVQELQYKLYMMGVPMDVPDDVFCDNQSVLLIDQKPETRISKKHNAIDYHRIREAAAGKWIHIAFKSGASNLADFLTKILPIREKERYYMETDAIERGMYADLVAEPPEGT